MLKDCNSRQRWILIGGIGSVFVIMICILYLYGSPKRLFERKFGFPLPESANILHSNFSGLPGSSLYMKVSFDAADCETIVSNFRTAFPSGFDLNTDLCHNFREDCDWWDFDMDDLLFAYGWFREGMYAKTNEANVYITQNTDDQYFLYIDY